MKDIIDFFISDVKIYSSGLFTSLENNRHYEVQDYLQNMNDA